MARSAAQIQYRMADTESGPTIWVHALSVGERKLVSAMHVAKSNATIKLIDDPAALLSQKQGAKLIRRIIQQTANDTAVISFSRAAALMDFNRVIKLRRGKIVFDGPPEQYHQRKFHKTLEPHPSST